MMFILSKISHDLIVLQKHCCCCLIFAVEIEVNVDLYSAITWNVAPLMYLFDDDHDDDDDDWS